MIVAYLAIVALAAGFCGMAKLKYRKAAKQTAKVQEELAGLLAAKKIADNAPQEAKKHCTVENERRRLKIGQAGEREAALAAKRDAWDARTLSSWDHLMGFVGYGGPLVTIYGFLEWIGFASPQQAFTLLMQLGSLLVNLWKELPGLS